MAADAMVCAFARPGAGENPAAIRPAAAGRRWWRSEVHEILAMAGVAPPSS